MSMYNCICFSQLFYRWLHANTIQYSVSVFQESFQFLMSAINAADVTEYIKHYSAPDGMHAGLELTIFNLIQTVPNDVRGGVVPNSSHWIPEATRQKYLISLVVILVTWNGSG